MFGLCHCIKRAHANEEKSRLFVSFIHPFLFLRQMRHLATSKVDMDPFNSWPLVKAFQILIRLHINLAKVCVYYYANTFSVKKYKNC